MGLYVDLYCVSDSCSMKKTRQYSTATNTIYIRAFHLLNGCSTIYVVVPVLVKFGFELLKLFTVGADIILSGNEF